MRVARKPSENEVFVNIFKRIRSPRNTPLTQEMQDVLNKYNLEYYKQGCGGYLGLIGENKHTNYCCHLELVSMGSVEKDNKVNWVNKVTKMRERNLTHHFENYTIDSDTLHIKESSPIDDRCLISSSKGHDELGRKLKPTQMFSYERQRKYYEKHYSMNLLRLICNIIKNKNKALKLLNPKEDKEALKAINIYNNAIDDGFIKRAEKVVVE